MGSQYALIKPKTNTFLSHNSDLVPRYTSTKTIQITESGDIDLGAGSGNFKFISGIDKIKQDVQIIMKSVKGSAYLNPELGVDLLTILEDEYDPQSIETAVRSAIMMHPDIIALKDLKVKSSSDYVESSDSVARKYYVESYAVTNEADTFFISVKL